MKRFFRYFIQGLIVLIPVSITVLVLYKMFSWIAQFFAKFDVIVHPYADPLLLVLAGVGLIVLVGVFASNVIARYFFEETSKVIEKIPFVRHIYSPVKDFTSAFIGNNKRFNHPVLVTTNMQTGIREIGFVTGNDLAELGIAKDFVAVYFPMSYAISGRLLIVPREHISPLDVPASEAMKFIVSGGVTEVE